MDTDRAYLLGLVIGGGVWGNAEDGFRIRLPYKQWGSCVKDPIRAGHISKDIMKVVGPMFRDAYGITVSYEANTSGEWRILCEGDLSGLVSDLGKYGIRCEGELRKSAEIDKLILDLVDDTMRRKFIAGLADTIGSTKDSHRRFNDDNQMVSFEISGFGYGFVCSLCKLLHSINCFPDQVAWNHPNFHITHNPFGKNWKKGFKIRVPLNQYRDFGAFAFTSKVESVIQNRRKQTKKPKAVVPRCMERDIRSPRVSCVHRDENSELLPPQIRGGHYLHYMHVCAVLGCEYAPYDQVSELVERAEEFINPFPVLLKGSATEITGVIDKHPIFASRRYSEHKINIKSLHEQFGEDRHALLFSINDASGYPINQVLNGVAYLVAAGMGKLSGRRVKGKAEDVLREWLELHPESSVTARVPEILTPMALSLRGNSVMVGPVNPSVYKKLIYPSSDNRYKFCVRPITEEDLK
jgi:hypothetical protein